MSDAIWKSPAAKGKVLLVDDEGGVLRAVTRLLERAGQTVVAVDNGDGALAQLRDTSFDAVVTDITMPGMSGIELLRAIRERDLDLPVVLMTGAPSLESAVEAISYGAFGYVPKPTFDRLVETTARAVGLGRIARAKRDAMQAATGEPAGASDLAGLEAALARAMASLWSAYQPIVDRNGKLFGHESLMRSREPSLPHPGAVLDAAEKLGMLEQLGTHMRDLCVRPVRESLESGDLFVNLHPRDLESPGLFDRDAPLAGIAERVVLEITERSSLPDAPEVRHRIAELRARGYRIAIDDLGAGYAGLTSFAVLEPEVVKLDMSLIRGVDTSATKQKVIGTFTGLAHDLGMLVVAEGIETREELAATHTLGCDLFQGFGIARPGGPFPAVSWPLAS